MDSNFYQTELDILINVPLTPSLNHQLYFATRTERDTYFEGHIWKSWNDFKYVRESRSVQVQGIDTEYSNVNYMRFKNKETGGLWIYAFIISTTYVNANSTLLNFKIDAWQTYYHDLQIKDCDIQREHVYDGNNWQKYTQLEGLFLGDYEVIFDSRMRLVEYDGALIMSTIDLIRSGGTIDNPIIFSAAGGTYNGLPSACALYYTNSVENFCLAIGAYPWVSQGVIGIYPVSETMIENYSTQNSLMGFSIGVLGTSLNPVTQTWGLGNIEPYLPQVINKKLWVYPYTYIEIESPDGNRCILKPELLPSGNLNLNSIVALIPTPSIYVYMSEYMGAINEDKYLTSITFNGFPSFPTLNNMYSTAKEQQKSMDLLIAKQNTQNIDFGLWGTVASSTADLLSGDIAGSINNTVGGIRGAVGEYRNEQQRAERTRLQRSQYMGAPALSGNSTPGACPALFADHSQDIRCRIYTVKPEMRGLIDKYFTVYGYLVNRIGSLNIQPNGRRFKFTKCNNVNMFGNIPQIYLEEIREMFLTGLMLWYDHTNVGVY